MVQAAGVALDPPPVGSVPSLHHKMNKSPGKIGILLFAVVLVVGLAYAGSQLLHDISKAPSSSAWPYILLGVALLIALGFEFVNGFHDTANAVATVIYTHSLEPHIAVVWSGLWNLIGVLTSSGGVAFAILSLLPVELILQVGSGAGFAMVFALLISAILWNLATWSFGLPASSSHTLIGSIIGVGLTNQLLNPHSGTSGVDWAQAANVFKALLISPLVGFGCSALLLLLMKYVIKDPRLFESPKGEEPPPFWIRGLLVLTCTGVSFGHGSNDGQKGMGLIMLILIGILPTTYAVDQRTGQEAIRNLSADAQAISFQMDRHAAGIAMAGLQAASDDLSAYLKTSGKLEDRTYGAVGTKCREISDTLSGKTNLSELNPQQRRTLRSDLYLTSETLGKMLKAKKLTEPDEQKS